MDNLECNNEFSDDICCTGRKPRDLSDFLMCPHSKESDNQIFDTNDDNDDNIVNNVSKTTAYNEKEDDEANGGDESKTGSDIYNSDAEDIKERKLRKNI